MIYNPYSLQGKSILVTGASSGIGRVTAIECSRLGASLFVTGRNVERLLDTYNSLSTEFDGQHKYCISDLTNSEDVDRIIDEMPLLDGVALCAGKGMNLPVRNVKKNKLTEIFEVNFFAPVELIRLLLYKKKINKPSSIVVISSVGGNYLFEPGNGVYGATKASLNSYVKFAASELAVRQTRVNAVCPGMVETPLIHRGIFTEEPLEEDAKKYPLKRYGQPIDVALAVIYLLSDASSWVTGTSLVVDGGISINSK